MAAEDGSNEVWHGDRDGHCTTYIAFLFYEPVKQKSGSPGNTKVRDFCHCTNVFDSLDRMLMKTLLQAFPLILIRY